MVPQYVHSRYRCIPVVLLRWDSSLGQRIQPVRSTSSVSPCDTINSPGDLRKHCPRDSSTTDIRTRGDIESEPVSVTSKGCGWRLSQKVLIMTSSDGLPKLPDLGEYESARCMTDLSIKSHRYHLRGSQVARLPQDHPDTKSRSRKRQRLF